MQQLLEAAGATLGGSVQQADHYFNHPSRDFAKTDEAVRLRTVSDASGDASRITYKGPKQGSAAKTRFELELPLADATIDGWSELLTRLGFRSVMIVTKRRVAYHVERTPHRFEVSLDVVEGLGAFAEIETTAEPAELAAAERGVNTLATELGLAEPEQRSYLEMLLEGR